MKTTRCKCCGMPMPIPESNNYTALPTHCRICRHIARQAVRASTRRVAALRNVTIMLGLKA